MRLSLLARLVRRPRWLLGFALGGLGFPLEVLAFADAPGNIATKLMSDDFNGNHVQSATTWIVVAAATGVAAIVSEMTALQRAKATTVVPVSFAVQTFLPIILEPVFLSERWSTIDYDGIPLVAGMVLMFIGTF